VNNNQNFGSSQRHLRHHLKDKALWGYVLLTLLLGFAYSAVNPIHEGTDELRHYRFVQYIIQNKTLPVQGQESCRSQSHHPPLYYLMASAVSFWVETGQDVCHSPQDNPFWGYRQWEVGTDNKNLYIHQPNEMFPWQGEALAAHLARGINVLLGGLAVAVTWLTARLIWPTNRWIAFGSVPLIAFLPQFLYMSGTLNNDIIAAVAGGLVCLVGVLLINRPGPLTNPVKWGIVFGVVYSLALMSKFNLAPFGLPLALVIVYKTLWQKEFRNFFVAGLTMTASTAALAGWWFVRNQILYGEPTGFRILTELWGVREASSSWGLLWIELPGIWSSFVGRFGFGQIPLPALVYQISWGLTFFAIFGIGFYLFWVIYNQNQMPLAKADLANESPHLLLLGLVAVIAIVVVFAYVLVSPAGAMGRFLFPGLPTFAILIFWGLTRWPILLGWNLDRPIAIALNMVMACVAVWSLFGYLQPAYARPDLTFENNANNATFFEPITFEPFVQLSNATVDKTKVVPGDFIELTMQWNVLDKPFGDFYFFAHLIDTTTGELIAQRDTQPATGKFPMSQWGKEDTFSDVIKLQVPETAHPGTANLVIGFYAPTEGYRLAVYDSAGNGLGDSYMVEAIQLVERDGDYPNAQNWNFEGRARLRGYEYSNRLLTAEEPLVITFYWDLLNREELRNTDVVVLLYGNNGEVLELRKPFFELMTTSNRSEVVIYDPTTGFDRLSSTNLWGISLILIDPFTGERVNMVTARGNWIDDELVLPSVQIR
jgi:hypothetical protein